MVEDAQFGKEVLRMGTRRDLTMQKALKLKPYKLGVSLFLSFPLNETDTVSLVYLVPWFLFLDCVNDVTFFLSLCSRFFPTGMHSLTMRGC